MSRPNYRAARNAALKVEAPTPSAARNSSSASSEDGVSTATAEPAEPFTYPQDWRRGQLLNVRNAGSHYNVTLLGEEFDTRYPDRCVQFPSGWECQDFVSWWYASQGQGR